MSSFREGEGVRQVSGYGLAAASRILLLCIVHSQFLVIDALGQNVAIAEAAYSRKGDTRVDAPPQRFQNVHARSSHVPVKNLKFSHLTTNDGLSQSYVTAILQDHRGFMWFATRDGLNRYDGNTFVVYKHNPNDPSTLSSNFLEDILEDEHGYLWVSTNTGVNKFDPATERCIRYRHDVKDPSSLSSPYVTRIATDSRGDLWFGTLDSGVDRLDPTTGRFIHYRNDSEGRFVGPITKVVADPRGDIWFVGDRGLFHLNPQTGQITRPRVIEKNLSAQSVYQDDAGNLWMLTDAPIAGLVEYDPHTERMTKYPLPASPRGPPPTRVNGGALNSLVADKQNGLWVASSNGLYRFDQKEQRYTYRFQHDDTSPESLDSNAVLSVYEDRSGVLWVGTENLGLNILNFRQEQFGYFGHRPGDPRSVSAGRVKAIYEDGNGVLWIGLFPRALDRVDRKTGRVTHYLPKEDNENALSDGTNVDAIYKDTAGYLWIGGGGCGLDRFDERTGRFKHYRHRIGDADSLLSDNVFTIYGDRAGRMWVGQQYGLSRYDPVTDKFINYRPVPDNPESPLNWIWNIYQDRSGTLWLGTFGGALFRFDDKGNTFVSYGPDPHDGHKLNGGGLTTVHEDRTGTLWVGGFDGLYRFDERQSGSFTRYTESDGLPSSTIRCIQEDRAGKLWLSTQRGISQFDSEKKAFRNYDVSDGLQSNEFSDGCYQRPDGETFFGGSNGFNAFFPENIRDNPFVPPVVITNFRIFNKPISIGTDSRLKKAIPYVDSLSLSYKDTVFSFEFAALSYANPQKNRYRYKLEGFDPRWNEVGSNQRLATYTNLNPGKYVFRVQASNSDGIWNEEGVSLPIRIMPPWWMTTWFRAFSVIGVLTLIWVGYQFRVRQLHRQFAITLDARVAERTRIARDLHDTLLQDFQAVLPLFQVGIIKLPEGAGESRNTLERALDQAEHAICVGRDAIKGLRRSTIEKNDLAMAIRTAWEELAAAEKGRDSVSFEVLVEGTTRELHPILRDEIYRLATEALRNAFRHADPKNVEVELRYDERYFRLRVRDDGKGIPSDILSRDGREGHYGLPGMRERARLSGGKLTIWTELDSGTEIELVIPGAKVYVRSTRAFWHFGTRSATEAHEKERIERE